MWMNSLDVSLDDLIRKNKQHPPHKTSHPPNRFIHKNNPNNRRPSRPTPYPFPPPTGMKVPRMPMPMPEPVIVGGDPSGTKLYLSNLDYGVSNDDIKLLFSDVGELKRYAIHYDRSGRSKGTAEVVFVRPSDALAAIKRYDKVNLDGKPMKIELVGVNMVTPIPMPVPAYNSTGKPFGASRSAEESQGGWGRSQGRGQGRCRCQGQGQDGASGHSGVQTQVQGRRGSSVGKPSAADLDAELEKYHLEAMQIN